MFFKKSSSSEVMEIIASLKDKTSTGIDKISNKNLKIAKNILSPLLSDFFNLFSERAISK